MTKNSSILSGLNDEQRTAAECSAQHIAIVAGPGTGKTRTLTHRIARLIAEGAAPQDMLAITFTNKAADEMREHLQTLCGSDVAERIVIRTFHAFGAMFLREEAQALNLPPKFSILDEQDRLALLKQTAPNAAEKSIRAWLACISATKNRLLTPDSPETRTEYKDAPDFLAAYRDYEAALRQAQALDFDDLVLCPVQALQTRPELLEKCRRRQDFRRCYPGLSSLLIKVAPAG